MSGRAAVPESINSTLNVVALAHLVYVFASAAARSMIAINRELPRKESQARLLSEPGLF
jgi:hypothetical protein